MKTHRFIFSSQSMRLTVISVFVFLLEISVNISYSKEYSGRDSELYNIDGEWIVTPYLQLNDTLPEGGALQEIRHLDWVENGMIGFWGRFADEGKKWAYYIFHNGRIQRLFVGGESFLAPNGKEINIRYWISSEDRVKGGRETVYWSNREWGLGKSIYAWDGDRIFHLIGEEESITLPSGEEFLVDKASDLFIANNGDAFIHVSGKRFGKKVDGYFLHDGKTLKPMIFSEDTLPGMPGVTVKGIKGTPAFYGDTTLVIFKVAGATYKEALCRIIRDTVQPVLTDEDKHPLFPEYQVGSIIEYRPGDSDHFMVQLDQGNFSEGYRKPWMAYVRGRWKNIVNNVKELPDFVHDRGDYNQFKLESMAYLRPNCDCILLSISLLRVEATNNIRRVLPGIFFFNGERITHIQTIPSGKELAETVQEKSGLVKLIAVPFEVQKMPGLGGAIVEIPVYKIGFSSRLYIQPDDVEGKLGPVPDMHIPDNKELGITNILGWVDANHFIAWDSKGIYEIKRK